MAPSLRRPLALALALAPWALIAFTSTPALAVPSLSISDVSQPEGNSGTTTFTFNVTLSDTSSVPVTVHYQTQNGTASAADADYTAASGTLTIPENTLSGTVSVNIVGDAACESDETFVVELSNPSGATLADGTGQATILNDDCLPDTTYIWTQHGFDRAADGACDTRGWTAQDRSTLVFAHVDDKHLINDAFIAMGGKALWFGVDANSHPQEVAQWYSPEGFGSNWSQRLTSPTFTNGNYRLEFDGSVALRVAPGLAGGTVNRFIAVQALKSNGKWAFLTARWKSATGSQIVGDTLQGRERFKCFVPTHPDSQPGFPFATPAQIRIVVQTPPISSDEDGNTASSPTPEGAAIVDNVRLRDLDPGPDPIPLHGFEDGTTGAWTLSARNGGNSGGSNIIRDVAAPNLSPSVEKDFDRDNPSCVWQFTSPSGYVEPGAWAYLVSPWIPADPAAIGSLRFLVRAKFPQGGLTTGRGFMTFAIRGTGPTSSFYARPNFQFFTPDETEGDFPFSLFQPSPSNVVGNPASCDHVQVILILTDQFERFSVDPSLRPPTRLPWFDDIRMVQYNADTDHDGVRDAADACPSVPAAGQDANGDGCPDATATLRHVESWSQGSLPIHYRLSQDGDPRIGDGSDLQALRDAFAEWQGVAGANVQVVEDATTSQTNASGTDGINLLTFQDDYAFPGNVLAITPTLSYTKRTAFDDVMRLPGEIVDADIIFNPNATFRTATAGPPTGSFDLKSVAVHEVGHLLGLSHSGTADATMFPVLQAGTLAASLESDDQAAIAAAYPGATLLTDYGRISGRVTRGSNGAPVPGALVMAVRLEGGSPADTAASDYTDENGDYALYRLPPGDYAVHIEPLDGSVAGVVPGSINARVEAIAETNFKPEWYGGPESNSDDPDVRQTLVVTAGGAVTADVVTNIDVTPPAVTSASPAGSSLDQRIDTPILVTFSESVASSTLGSAFKLHAVGGGGTLGGSGQLLTPGLSFVFVPQEPLAFSTDYEIEITTALEDVEGNALAGTYTSGFRTQDRPPVSIGDVSPREAPLGALVTLTGTGYDASPGAQNKVYFSTSAGFADYVLGSQVTPTSMVVEVPADAVSGPVKVQVGAEESNLFTFSLLTSEVDSPSPSGDAVSVGFPPSDVAFSPDGKTAYAVGSGGFARINLDPLRPSYGVAAVSALGECRGVALLPSGQRAYVTRPRTGEVVEVDADPLSGTFGQQMAVIALPGTPEGIAVSPSGQRAYVTGEGSGVVYELDVDPSSGLNRHLLREIAIPDAHLAGGIAVDARRERLVVTTTNLGLLSVDLDTTAIVTTLSGQAGTAGVAMTPGGTRVLSCVAAPDAGTLVTGDPLGGTPASVEVGGDARDVVVSPDGATALVANAFLRRLQVLDVTQATPRLVGNVATGAAPVAVALSGSGSQAVVANFGDQTVSFYNVVSTATPVRVTPPVAAPGDRVAVAVTGGTLSGGIQIETGTASAAALLVQPTAAAFEVPAGDAGSTTVTLISSGVRSLGLPFKRVDPIAALDPRATGIALDPVDMDCGSGPIDGSLRLLRVSPDGKLLAVSREGPSCARVDVYQVVPDAVTAFGARLVDGAMFPGATEIRDLAYSPDGTRLWVATDAAGLFELNVDAESPGLGTVLPFGGATVGWPRALASDPMGRYVVVGTEVTPGTSKLQLWAPGRTLSSSVSLPGALLSLVVTPDGGYAVVGGQGQAYFVELATAALVASTPLHTVSPPDDITSVAVTTHGRHAIGLFPGNHVAIWNVDPAAGTVGSELYFGAISVPGAVSQLAPAADGSGILAGCADCATLARITPGTSPTTASATLGQPSRALARSADGRTLWVSDWSDATRVGGITAFTFAPGTTFALVSGAGQSAAAGQPLPLPARVHLIDDATGRDVPGALVRFSLAGSSQGSIDGGSLQAIKPTDATGEAEVSWTMPPVEAGVTLTAEALGIAGATLAVTASSTVDESVALPAVVGVGPVNGASGINAGTEVFVRFSQRMAASSVDSGLVFIADGASVGRTLRFENDDRDLFIKPAQLPYSKLCGITLATKVRDQQGQAMPVGFASSFTVQAPPVLAISSLSPPSAPPGATVTLNGQGLSPVASANTVSFNGNVSPVLSASDVSLVTTVPNSATTGPLTLTVGAATSTPVAFTVLPTDPPPLLFTSDSDVRKGIEAIAVTPDAGRAYITLPFSNSVLAFDIQQRQVIRTIPVGLRPQGVAIDPNGRYAYVVNSGSDNVSVIDINPASPDYHKPLAGPAYPIQVGDEPTTVVVSAFGPTVLVGSAGSGTISVIDANPDLGTFGRVTSTVNVGSSVKSVTVTPDGTSAYMATSEGIVVVDVASRAVTSTIKIGSGGTSVTVTPDGTLLFALSDNGFLNVIDIAPGSRTFNQVTSSTAVGSGGKTVTVSPDGTLLYLTLGDEDVAEIFRIIRGVAGGAGSDVAPGPPASLDLLATVPVGDGPAGIAIMPDGSAALVVNEISGTVTRLQTQPGATAVTTPTRPAVLSLGVQPTPSFGTATLRFALTRRTPVEIEIFDLQGRLVKRVVDGVFEPGAHTATWSGDDRRGGSAGAGVYFARLRAEGRTLHARVVWLR